mgnify:CR=1 FL=1
MKYDDALTAPISERLTKAKLIEISKALQVHALADELTEEPAWPLIFKGFNQLYKQLRYEIPLLIKDVSSAGTQARTVFNNAYARAFD